MGRPQRRLNRAALLGVGLLVVVLTLAAARVFGAYLPEFVRFVDSLGVWGPLLFIAAYTVGVVLWIPGTLLTLTAGALFDVGPGTLYVFIGATLGSAIAFLTARYLARSWVEGWLAPQARFAAVDRAIGERGLWIVFLLRLSPAVPFTPINFLLGITGVGFRDYMLASVGMIPASLLYVYSGKVVADVAQVAGGAAPERGLVGWVLLALGLAATLAATVVITRVARRALGEQVPEPPPRR